MRRGSLDAVFFASFPKPSGIEYTTAASEECLTVYNISAWDKRVGVCMMFESQKWVFFSVAVVLSLLSSSVIAVDIDNGFTTSQQGYWRVTVTDGGESISVHMTGTGTPSNTVHEDIGIVFNYYSYVDTGSGGVRLSDTTVTTPTAISGPGEITSAGTFTGSNGNTIEWTMVSSIEPGSSVMVNELELVSLDADFGTLDFYQYLDEDVLGFSDDVFFTKGTSGTDLELFTVDNAEAIGVSHSGAQFDLNSATFSGWAACRFDQMKPLITTGTQSVSGGGVICNDLAAAAMSHPVVGPSFGPIDVVSVLAWNINSDDRRAVIITTIGGVPDISAVIPLSSVPVPALNRWMLALLTLLLGGVALWTLQRRRLMN